jgi:hypothetical protein
MKTQNDLVKELFEYLDYTETTDSGRAFHPVYVSCCRVAIQRKISDCLKDLKESIR